MSLFAKKSAPITPPLPPPMPPPPPPPPEEEPAVIASREALEAAEAKASEARQTLAAEETKRAEAVKATGGAMSDAAITSISTAIARVSIASEAVRLAEAEAERLRDELARADHAAWLTYFDGTLAAKGATSSGLRGRVRDELVDEAERILDALFVL